MKRVLLVAYHFPPVGFSSGVQRTLRFARYLAEFGWEPLVLTVHPRAYPGTRDDQLAEVPPGMVVHRAFGLDAARHLSFRGNFLRRTALPDRWVSWWLGAVPAGLRLVRRYRPRILWSTYPIATAHLIGGTLQRLTGLPWVADFRDSMTEDGYPRNQDQWRAFRSIEARTVARCRRAVFTTPSALRMYAERYPEQPPSRWAEIANGYDEESFTALPPPPPTRPPGPVTLVHSGVIYPQERDPRPFFRALGALKTAGRIGPARLRVVLRAAGHADFMRRHIVEAGIEDLVELAPGIAYAEALEEMTAADGLLLFQSAGCNHQIPAKLYEYLRAGRPILALTDAAGDTAAVLRQAGVGRLVPLDDAEAIAAGLEAFLEDVERGRAVGASPEEAARHSRRARTGELARLFDEVLGEVA